MVRLREVSGLCFRIAREVRGAGTALARSLAGPDGRLSSTLIVSPPGPGRLPSSATFAASQAGDA